MSLASRLLRPLLLVMFLAAPLTCAAQQPLLTRIEPNLAVVPQYFSVVQATDNMLYVGYDGGVLRYDGIRWSAIKAPRPGAVRSLLVDRNGRTWVGGNDWFGYIQRQADGSDRLIDVASGFAERLGGARFADVWRMLERDEGIYIGALHHLFLVDMQGQAKNMWQSEGRFGAMAEVNGEFWVQWRGEGLKRLVGDRFEMLPGGEAFAANLIYNLLPMPGGRVLLRSLDPHFAIWENGAFVERSSLTRNPESGQFGAALILDAHRAAFAGDDGVMRIVDVDAQTIHDIPVGKSFISQIARGRDDSLLIVSDEGVARMRWPARWIVYDERNGLHGAMHSFAQIDDDLYLLSGSGVFRARLVNGELTLPFEPLFWTENESWELARFGDELLLAEGHTLLSIDNGEAHKAIEDGLYPRALLVSQDDPGLLWVGTEQGVSVLRRDNGQWRVIESAGGLGVVVSSLARRDEHSVWAGGVSGGLMVASWNAGRSPALMFEPAKTDSGLDLTTTGETEVSAADGSVLVSNDRGLYRIEDGRIRSSEMDGLASLKAIDELLTFHDGRDGDLWASSYRALYRRHEGKWEVANLGGLGLGAFEGMTVLPDGDALIGGAGTILRRSYSTAARRFDKASLQVIRIQLDARIRGHAARDLPIVPDNQVESGSGALTFSLAMPELSMSAAPRFRYRLSGLDQDWSDWTERAEISYSALQPGDYALNYQSRWADGSVLSGEPFPFSISPRWFERNELRIAAMLLLLVAVVLLLQRRHRRRLQRLFERNQELDALVHARTAELQAANMKLRTLAERDGLTGLSNRQHFDVCLKEAFAWTAHNGLPLSVMMIDVDDFKQFNDTHGHQAGDDALRTIAAVVTRCLRDQGTSLARYGGEEFVVIAKGCDSSAAERVAERLLQAIREDPVGLTISIGVATHDPQRDRAPGQLLERADAALYEAKRRGRNRVVIAS
jgi:diguanylate cyclase (GGDEF)-like protein